MKSLLLLCITSLSFELFAQTSETGITAAYENGSKHITIKWQHNNPSISGYVLQRSNDRIYWIEVTQVSFPVGSSYQFIRFTDRVAPTGKNFYRLKISFSNGINTVSTIVTAVVGNTHNNWIMYPVPVKDVLNLQYNGTQLIPGIIGITIERNNGMVFHRLRYASSSRDIQIPVSNLGRGMYYISIHINQQLVWRKAFTK